MVDVNNLKYSDFCELTDEINKCLEWYENSKNFAFDTQFTLYLSNGDRINYSIPQSSVAHLLGINTEEIKLWNFFQTKSSYNLLRIICDDTYGFYNRMKKLNKSFKSVVSPYIDTKISIFKTHFLSAKEKINTFEFVCQYNNNNAYINGEDAKGVDYVIATRNGDLMTLLGLVKSTDGGYIPITSQMFDLTTEEGKKTLGSFIRNQVLLLPETLKSKKGYFQENGFLFDDVVLSKMENLEQYANEYGCIIDVSHAFKHSKKKDIDSRTVAVAVCESMVSGNPVEDIEFKGKVPKYLQDLLLYTKSLQPTSRKEEIKRLKEYEKLLLECQEKQQEIERLNEERARLLSRISELNQVNDSLISDRDRNNEVINKIRKLVLE